MLVGCDREITDVSALAQKNGQRRGRCIQELRGQLICRHLPHVTEHGNAVPCDHSRIAGDSRANGTGELFRHGFALVITDSSRGIHVGRVSSVEAFAYRCSPVAEQMDCVGRQPVQPIVATALCKTMQAGNKISRAIGNSGGVIGCHGCNRRQTASATLAQLLPSTNSAAGSGLILESASGPGLQILIAELTSTPSVGQKCRSGH
jgi:hypothetical protein